MKLPSNVEEVIVQSGRVRVRTTADVFEQHLSLMQGKSQAQFLPLSDADLASSKFPLQLQFPLPDSHLAQCVIRSETGEKVEPKTICETGINALPDWSIANGKTLHLMPFERHHALEITLHGPWCWPHIGNPCIFAPPSPRIGQRRCSR